MYYTITEASSNRGCAAPSESEFATTPTPVENQISTGHQEHLRSRSSIPFILVPAQNAECDPDLTPNHLTLPMTMGVRS
jgi:hypothetical protein